MQQLIQNQQNFSTMFAQFLMHQANISLAGAGPLSLKKIIVSPETYNGSPQKFHKWWSKSRSRSTPPMPPPPISRRWWLFTCIWRGLMQAILHKFASMSAWQMTCVQPGQHSRQRLRGSSCPEKTESGQGPNSCIFIRGSANT